ncbi:MAG: hypothetical protein GAK38_04485 [Xylophilus sp.]|nr:MAG: hypothetical protein GAK38_04485 [Xylophilus sp.]
MGEVVSPTRNEDCCNDVKPANSGPHGELRNDISLVGDSLNYPTEKDRFGQHDKGNQYACYTHGDGCSFLSRKIFHGTPVDFEQ